VSTYNHFGAAYTEIAPLYPGVADADLGGQAAIESVMDRAEALIAAALPQAAHDILTAAIEYEVLADGSTTGTGLTLGLTPIDDTVYIWRYGYQPAVRPRPGVDGETDYTRSGTSITLDTALVAGEWVLARYAVDRTSLSMPELAAALVYLAGAECGAQIYLDRADGENSNLVEAYASKGNEIVKMLRHGQMPETLRRLQLWAGAAGGSIYSLPKVR
jgi:hypothetical protein